MVNPRPKLLALLSANVERTVAHRRYLESMREVAERYHSPCPCSRLCLTGRGSSSGTCRPTTTMPLARTCSAMPGSRNRTLEDPIRQALLEASEDWDLTPVEDSKAIEASFERLERVLLIPIERISPTQDNPRQTFTKLDELAASIEAEGLIQPLVVRRDPHKPGHYVTVAGARRLMAANLLRGHEDAEVRARVAKLPCVVVELGDDEALAKALAENVARQDLTRAELMEAVLRLERDFGWSGNRIAKAMGRSQGDISVLLRVAKDPELSALVRKEVISPSAAGELVQLPEEQRRQALSEVYQGRLRTVDQVRRLNTRRQTARSRVIPLPTEDRAQDAPSPPEEKPSVPEAQPRAEDAVGVVAARESAPATPPRSRGSDRWERDVLKAREHAAALRQVVEQHPLVSWEPTVREHLQVVVEAYEAVSGVPRWQEAPSPEVLEAMAGRAAELIRAVTEALRGRGLPEAVADRLGEVRRQLRELEEPLQL